MTIPPDTLSFDVCYIWLFFKLKLFTVPMLSCWHLLLLDYVWSLLCICFCCCLRFICAPFAIFQYIKPCQDYDPVGSINFQMYDCGIVTGSIEWDILVIDANETGCNGAVYWDNAESRALPDVSYLQFSYSQDISSVFDVSLSM